MKLNGRASAVIVAVLAFWAINAKAQVLQKLPTLNFSLIAAQQGLDVSETSSNVFVSTIKTVKITNQDILKFLAMALNTNWPAGAQLARFATDIFVVDKTGTNLVFDVSTGINAGDTNVVFFSTDSDRAVVRSELEAKGELIVFTNEFGPEVGISNNSGSIKVGGGNFGKIFFHLFYERDGVTNTDLYFDGLNAIEFHSNRVLASNKITGYGITSEQAPVTGDGTLNLEWTVIKGKVTSSWKEHGGIAVPSRPPIMNPPPIPFPPPSTNRPPPSIFSPRTNPPPPVLLEP